MLKIIYEKLWCIFALAYWTQLYSDFPYSKSFDKWCKESLAKGCKFTNITGHTAMFNGEKIWITNHPHASFHTYERGKPQVSPSRYTKKLMQERLDNSLEF